VKTSLDAGAAGSQSAAGQHIVGEEQLASGALGLRHVLFYLLTGAAPIGAMLFSTPLAVSGAGFTAPATFLVGGIVLMVFAVGYVAMARKVTAAGGFYSFVSHGFGRVLGMGTAVLIASCYVIYSAATAGTTAYFANTTFQQWFGVDIPVWLIAFATLGIMATMAFLGVAVNARVLGTLLVAEIVGLLIFTAAVLLQGGHSGLSAEPLNVAKIFSGNNNAIAAASGIALFAAFSAYLGLEVAPNYAEETLEPKKQMGRATYGAILGIGAFYIIVSYAFVIGWGTDRVAGGVSSQYSGHIASAFYPLTDHFVGGWLTTVFMGLIITGNFGSQAAFFSTATRYVFSMGRERVLPQALSRTHPTRKSPHIAIAAVTAVAGLYVLGFTLYDSSTVAALTKLGTWGPIGCVFGIVGIEALVSLAIVWHFRKEAKDAGAWWATAIAPITAAGMLIYMDYLILKYRGDLTGAGDATFIRAIPWMVSAIFLVGVVMALIFKARSPSRYDAIGRLVQTEIAYETPDGRAVTRAVVVEDE
jgi:amino acid transporter